MVPSTAEVLQLVEGVRAACISARALQGCTPSPVALSAPGGRAVSAHSAAVPRDDEEPGVEEGAGRRGPVVPAVLAGGTLPAISDPLAGRTLPAALYVPEGRALPNSCEPPDDDEDEDQSDGDDVGGGEDEGDDTSDEDVEGGCATSGSG